MFLSLWILSYIFHLLYEFLFCSRLSLVTVISFCHNCLFLWLLWLTFLVIAVAVNFVVDVLKKTPVIDEYVLEAICCKEKKTVSCIITDHTFTCTFIDVLVLM